MITTSQVACRQIPQLDASDDTPLHRFRLIDLAEWKPNVLEKARTLDLDKSQYQAKLGIAHSINNSLNLAKPSFQETVRLKPSNLSAHYNFAPCLFNVGESESAVVEVRWI